VELLQRTYAAERPRAYLTPGEFEHHWHTDFPPGAPRPARLEREARVGARIGRLYSHCTVVLASGLSAIILIAYLLQGYFDALRGRMLARIGALFDAELQPQIYFALVSLPLRGTKPILAQQPLRDLDQVRAFLSGSGPTAFLDMPWIPLFLIPLFLFHPAIGVVATCGAGAIIAMTLVTEWQARGATKVSTEGNAQRQVLSDALRQNADVIRALGMTGRLAERWSTANEHHIHHNTRLADVHANLGAAAKSFCFLAYILHRQVQSISHPGGERNSCRFPARDCVDLFAPDIAFDRVNCKAHQGRAHIRKRHQPARIVVDRARPAAREDERLVAHEAHCTGVEVHPRGKFGDGFLVEKLVGRHVDRGLLTLGRYVKAQNPLRRHAAVARQFTGKIE
jgi:hypothetical protein